MSSHWISMSLPVVALILAGCGGQAEESPSGESAQANGAQYLLASEPSGAKPVIDARAAVKDNEDVVVVGRIGGSADPWVDNVAAFSIVDPSLKACSDIPGDACPVPWDYCCETDKLPKATALVKLVDENGKPVSVDARKLLNVKELQTVVVRGKAKRDEAGNLTVLASGIYPRKSP